LFLVSCLTANAQQTPEKPLIQLDPAAFELQFTDIAGQKQSPDSWKDQTVVLVFIGLECPVANSYVPTIKELQLTLTGKKATWLAVHSDRGVTKAQAEAHVQQFALKLPVILDSKQTLAAAVGAVRIGQVVILNNNQVVYRGRIDDRFALNGKRRDQPSTHDLRDALSQVIAGHSPAVFELPAFGCPIPFENK
jgi:hypothetical protein